MSDSIRYVFIGGLIVCIVVFLYSGEYTVHKVKLLEEQSKRLEAEANAKQLEEESDKMKSKG